MFLSSYNKINVTFCGMMGSGKSVIGKRFAKLIDFKFIDTDKFIEEKTGKSINNIFKDHGESGFRELEEKIHTRVLDKKNHVISLGGGSLINSKIRKIN